MSSKTPSTISISRALNTLLDSYHFPLTLDLNTRYSRVQDDCEGIKDHSQALSVIISHDSDVWIFTGGGQPLRFRMPLLGGGMSPRVRNGVLVLAEAIRRDNEESPYLSMGSMDDSSKEYMKPTVKLIISCADDPHNDFEGKSALVDTGLRADELSSSDTRAVLVDQFEKLYCRMWKVSKVSIIFSCNF